MNHGVSKKARWEHKIDREIQDKVNHGVSKKVRWEHKIDREIQDRSEPWCIKESEMGT